jgi:hypothetical protein
MENIFTDIMIHAKVLNVKVMSLIIMSVYKVDTYFSASSN